MRPKLAIIKSRKHRKGRLTSATGNEVLVWCANHSDRLRYFDGVRWQYLPTYRFSYTFNYTLTEEEE